MSQPAVCVDLLHVISSPEAECGAVEEAWTFPLGVMAPVTLTLTSDTYTGLSNLGKSLHRSGPQFPHLMDEGSRTRPLGCLRCLRLCESVHLRVTICIF